MDITTPCRSVCSFRMFMTADGMKKGGWVVFVCVYLSGHGVWEWE